jgi:hypothetical protein
MLVYRVLVYSYRNQYSLQTKTDDEQGSVHAATFFIWMTLSAASICLISNMLLLRWFSTHFARTLANAFLKLHECLTLSMDDSFGLDGGNVSLGSTSRHKQLLDELIAESGQLDSAYSIAAFELRLGRISGRRFLLQLLETLNISQSNPSSLSSG